MMDVLDYSVPPSRGGVIMGNLRGTLQRFRSVPVEPPAIVIDAS